MANNLPTDKKVLAVSMLAVSMLAEGNSIRSIERITGVHRDTIMRLGVRVGYACAKIQNDKLRGLKCKHIEVDEIWGFIGKKAKHATTKDYYTGIGDVWTWIALDADSKLIPSFVVGKRDSAHARLFMRDLSERLENEVQISSDALPGYADAVEQAFGTNADYGQIVKTYSVTNLNQSAAGRYSPADVVKTEKTLVSGFPDIDRICTSHIESQNLTLRMHCRRLTRLTNAFSKKFENFEAAVALNFAYYNLVKIHSTVKTTPAVAEKPWTVAELVERCGE